MKIRFVMSFVAIFVAISVCAMAQNSPPAFEAASIKPNKSAGERPREEFSPGRYTATNVTLRYLIQAAYQIPNPYGPRHYLSGGPDWLDSQRFDIVAKAGDGDIGRDLSTKDHNDRIRLMLQTLLADRFQLKLHRETKELPVYEMVVAKNGPKFQKTKDQERDCPGIPVGFVACGGRITGGAGRGMRAHAVDMSELAQALSNFADRPIIDKTGIDGLFDINLTAFRPDRFGPNFAAEVHADPESLPTIFTMVEDQLGLKLESRKGPVVVIVIDSVQKPSEN